MPRSRARSPAPLAVAADGTVLINVAYVSGPDGELPERLRGRPVSTWVALTTTGAKAVVLDLQDAVAEAVARLAALRQRRGGR